MTTASMSKANPALTAALSLAVIFTPGTAVARAQATAFSIVAKGI
jgi:hypothetical protein